MPFHFLRYFHLFFFSIVLGNVNSQNLVINGSFEDTLCCNTIYPSINCASFWTDPTGLSSDLIHSNCSALPTNYWDPGNDEAFSGLWNFFDGYDQSEYIEGKLSQKLDSGRLYCISFILRPHKTGLVSDGIGIYFSNTLLDTSVGLFNYLLPQILNPSGNIFTDTSQWSTFSGEFVAQGGEEYFIIGNFRTSDSTKWDTIGSGPTIPQGYIYIDNIELYDCTDTTSINETEKFFQTSIYPNPANNVLNLEINSASNNRFRWKISDVTGRNIQADVCNNDKNKIDVSFLSNGIYFVLINDLTSGLSKTEKFIIKKE